MRSWIDHAGEVVWDPSPALVTQLVAAGQPFWLDIEDPKDEIINQLATSLGLHPLAVQHARQFGQRAKLQVYQNGALLVGFGLDERLHQPVEVHCYCTTGFLITLRARRARPWTPCAVPVRSIRCRKATRSGCCIR